MKFQIFTVVLLNIHVFGDVNAVSLGQWVLMFLCIIMPSSSVLGLLDHEDEGAAFLQNLVTDNVC